MAGKYTDDDMTGLSPEERDAINGVDESEGDEQSVGDDADDDAEDDEDDDSGTDDTTADAAADDSAADTNGDDAGAVDSAAADAASSADDDSFPVVTDLPAIAFVPTFSGEILPEYQSRIDEIDAKFDAGDIDAKTHRAAVRKLEAASQNTESSTQLWNKQQEVFLQHNPQFSADKNRIMFGALNQEVIRLANTPESAGKSGLEILYAAKQNVEKALGIVKQSPTAKPDDKKLADKPKAARPTLKTLADVPAADKDNESGDRFAALDKMVGIELERALSKLSAADYEAYTRGN